MGQESLSWEPHTPNAQSMRRGALPIIVGIRSALYHTMIEVDDSGYTPDHIEFLKEWANVLGVSVEVLLGRIVVATIEGFLFIEKIPDYYPE